MFSSFLVFIIHYYEIIVNFFLTDLNYKGIKNGRHLLVGTVAVDLQLCSISHTTRSRQSLSLCCQKGPNGHRRAPSPVCGILVVEWMCINLSFGLPS